MKQTFLCCVFFCYVILNCVDGMSMHNVLPTKKGNQILQKEKKTGGGNGLCFGSNAADITSLEYLLQYTFQNFVLKGATSIVAHDKYLADIANLLSDNFNFFQLTSIEGLTLHCSNKTCMVATFDGFTSSYESVYGSNNYMPYVTDGPTSSSCYIFFQSLETAAYFLPNSTSFIYLQVQSAQRYTYERCTNNHCAYPWLITQWLSLDYFFEPLNTPIYTNEAAFAAFPFPS